MEILTIMIIIYVLTNLTYTVHAYKRDLRNEKSNSEWRETETLRHEDYIATRQIDLNAIITEGINEKITDCVNKAFRENQYGLDNFITRTNLENLIAIEDYRVILGEELYEDLGDK